tara:strand:+ start:145 stop:519 length:375 start_codon:yes stop_codon:yes gene_type:complete
MDFIFNINNGPQDDNNHEDVEDILSDIESHFEDWNNFYNLYQMFAPPPTDNSKQIQAWFKELQSSFFTLIKKYNNKIRQFAEIQDIETDEVQEMMKDAMSLMKKGKKPTSKKKESSDDVGYMYS